MDFDRALELLVDTESAAGVAATSALIVVVAIGLRLVLVPFARRRFADDPYRRYWSGKVASYAIVAVVVIALVALWAPLGGRLSVILGFATAGIAFAMQEVIGALFGWINILAGRIYTVGDRIEIAGVRGDVADITPLRTKLFEIGSETGGDRASGWVSARQPTGRMVTVSNRKTFTDPVFNFSAHLDWIWEEIVLSVPQDADWANAERILDQEIRRYAPRLREQGEAALVQLGERYLVTRAEVEPQTFIRVAEGDIEIVGRFVVAVHGARQAKDEILRRALERFFAEGLTLAYPTYSVDLSRPPAEAEPAAGLRPGSG